MDTSQGIGASAAGRHDPAGTAHRWVRAGAAPVVLACLLAGCSGAGSNGAAGSGSPPPSRPTGVPGASSSGSAQPSASALEGGSALSRPLDPRPTVGRAEPAAPVPGYTYTTASKVAVHAVAVIGRQYAQETTGWVVQGLVRGGRRVGDVVSFGLNPAFASNALFQGQFLTSVVTGLAGTHARVSYQSAGETSAAVASGRSAVAAGWKDGGLLRVVLVPAGAIATARAFVVAAPHDS